MRATVSTFTQLFSATPHGARRARRLVAARMDLWGHPRGEAVNDAVTLVVAELAANAVRHGRVRGRGFRVRLVLDGGDVLRVEVSDARVDRLPALRPAQDGESGRGLLLVAGVARAWGVDRRGPGATYKTVWADVPLDVSRSARTAPPACRPRSPIAR
ncbi:ATP-binding protein [Streptomyces sp. enrichment culture]|uniref:ATP-binding protein n=1 Tax=Streptomyces sp. enrichment culture TaxID=1795815 RepID=UPI003F57E718